MWWIKHLVVTFPRLGPGGRRGPAEPRGCLSCWGGGVWRCTGRWRLLKGPAHSDKKGYAMYSYRRVTTGGHLSSHVQNKSLSWQLRFHLVFWQPSVFLTGCQKLAGWRLWPSWGLEAQQHAAELWGKLEAFSGARAKNTPDRIWSALLRLETSDVRQKDVQHQRHWGTSVRKEEETQEKLRVCW